MLKKLEAQYNAKVDDPDLAEDRKYDFHPGHIIRYMRRDYAVYSFFYRKLIPAIVGKRFFGRIMKDFKPETMDENSLCTYSDEALASLGFDNSYEMWYDI